MVYRSFRKYGTKRYLTPYFPGSKNLEDCPVNGIFRNCIYEAVKKFQEKYADEILAENGKTEKASGHAGPKTLAKLNELYGK